MTTAEAGAPERLEWEVRLWERDPPKRARLFAVVAAIGVASGYAFGLVLGILSVFFLLGSTMEFWYPVRYRLDAQGASAKVGISVTAIEWRSVRRAILGEDGVKLSPLEKASRTAVFRGVYIRFNRNREEVLEFVRRRLPEDAAFLG
ncbi:MAG: hypothetical protein N2109_09100 [Fimbriimonadales bacterium]|nr:hypothetical protein [Fimbriimonadales bacterium]